MLHLSLHSSLGLCKSFLNAFIFNEIGEFPHLKMHHSIFRAIFFFSLSHCCCCSWSSLKFYVTRSKIYTQYRCTGVLHHHQREWIGKWMRNKKETIYEGKKRTFTFWYAMFKMNETCNKINYVVRIQTASALVDGLNCAMIVKMLMQYVHTVCRVTGVNKCPRKRK